MNCRFVLAGFLVLFSLAGVQAASISCTQPVTGQEFVAGDSVPLQCHADVNLLYLGSIVAGPEGSYILGEQTYANGTFNYNDTWNTTGFPAGAYRILLVGSYLDGTAYHTVESPRDALSIILRESGEPAPDENASARVIRASVNTTQPGSTVYIRMLVFPRRDFTGIILTERIPQGFTSWGAGGDGVDWKYDAGTRDLKIVVRQPGSIGTNYMLNYAVSVDRGLAPGTVLPLSGQWEILGETGQTIGKQAIRIAGVPVPDCPMPDTVLLGYIDQWSRFELDNTGEMNNDRAMLQIIAKWKTC